MVEVNARGRGKKSLRHGAGATRLAAVVESAQTKHRARWLLALFWGLNFSASGVTAQDLSRKSLQACNWCGAAEAPDSLGWNVRIAGAEEPGELLVMSGTVYRVDGVTPASGVGLYLYHTNARGVYPRRGDEAGNGQRHGYIRAWLRTNERGQYQFTTIRPAPYPGGDAPAHIHVTVTEPGRAEYWLDSFIFEGDPLITPRYRSRLEGVGGSGIVALAQDDEAVWRGHRDIVLER